MFLGTGSLLLFICCLLLAVSASCRPQAKIFNLFDELMLLNRGDIVYQGPAKGALDYFDRSGFPCPAYENPADHFLGEHCRRVKVLRIIAA